MYVKKLIIKNFRCFAEAEVELNYPSSNGERKESSALDNVTLFVGESGSGKSSIFQALSLAVLAQVINNSGLRVDSFIRRASDNPITLLDTDIQADLILNNADAGQVSKEGTVAEAIIHCQNDYEIIAAASKDAKVWNRMYINASPAFFLVGYGANRRASNPEGYSERGRSYRYQRVASLFEENFGLVPFTLGYLELTRAGLIEEARDILNKFLLINGISLSDQFDREKRPLFESNGVSYPYPALSDAHRNYISWIWDLLVQMARVQRPSSDFMPFRDLTGVVMVDLIDLYLPPNSQSRMIRELAILFPNLQFLFSAQSTSELAKENVRDVKRITDESVIKEHDEISLGRFAIGRESVAAATFVMKKYDEQTTTRNSPFFMEKLTVDGWSHGKTKLAQLKELSIRYAEGKDGRPARIRVVYRSQPGANGIEREADFKFDITPQDRRDIQWYLEEYLQYPWGEFRIRAAAIKARMEVLGQELFQAVFSSAEMQSVYSYVVNSLVDTRIIIHADSPEGIALPWELLRDPVRGEYGELAHLALSFVRSESDLFFDVPEPKESKTFNILMVICRPGGPEGDVAFQSVARPLLELFRPYRDRIRLDILRPPTFEQLTQTLFERPNYYHVLHFDGHGTFPKHAATSGERYVGEGEQGRLLFEGEDGKPRLVTGQEMGELLAATRVPVVLLNACQSGMTHPEAIYPSVGNQLLKAGTCGVVAMAYSIYVQTAARFMARLYEGLINGEELARAVHHAREDLRAHSQRQSAIGPIELQDWIVPILFEYLPVALMPKPVTTLHLSPELLKDEQATAGAEIGCPEPPAYGFIGRDGVLLELERAFQKETIVLLQGMAGVGKTEIAAGFARWYAETGGLEGPIFFFSFTHYLPLSQVCDRVGQTFQPLIKQQLQEEWELLGADQRRNVALSLLKQIPCLLVWDNFEPVAGFPAGSDSDWKQEEQQELRSFLRGLKGGRTKVLLTSRREEGWLGKIYRRVEVDGLNQGEAKELAVRVLEDSLGRDEVKALPNYTELLKYLQGNPLAIQVILPELKRIKPEVLLQSLQSGTAHLSQDDAQLGREHSLVASLTYRLDHIDPTIHQRLALLGLFQGFVNARALANLCNAEDAPEIVQGIDWEGWIQILERTTEVGLMRSVGEGYYTIHPVLPWFFHDLFIATYSKQKEWLESRFAEVYGDYGAYLYQLFNTRAQLAMQLLSAEESSLVHALRLARNYNLWESVAGVLYGLGQLWTTQGRWGEWERVVAEMVKEASDKEGNPLPDRISLWMALLGHRQQIAGYRRDFEQQQHLVLCLNTYYENLGDERNQAVSFHHLGTIAQKRQAFEEAEQWYRQALEIARRIGAEYEQASNLHQLGMLAQERHAFEEAERWYRQALEISLRIVDEHGQALTLYQMGRIEEEEGRVEEALRFFHQAEAMLMHLNDPHSLGIVQRSIERVRPSGGVISKKT